MATFLTTTDTSASIERVIRNAKRDLTLVSAYVYPRIIYLQRLKDAAARGVRITMIFGKKRMDEKVMDLLREIDNLSIFYLHELHAKCFVNEEEAVITSLNLLNGSEEKNREMGVRLERSTDRVAYHDCVAEVRSILAVAKRVHASPEITPKERTLHTAKRKPVEMLPETGYCIRCRAEHRCDPDKPMCYEDFKVWVQYEDPEFEERYCNACGKEGDVSMAHPFCGSCREKYAGAIQAMDDERGGLRASRSWREEF